MQSVSYVRNVRLSIKPSACKSLAVSCTASNILLLCFIINLHQRSFSDCLNHLFVRQMEQISSQCSQRFQFLDCDVVPLVFLKSENKEPPVVLVGCQQCSCATSLSSARKRNPFFICSVIINCEYWATKNRVFSELLIRGSIARIASLQNQQHCLA